MIAVDTNVLVRLFVNDDERQHNAATLFFASRSREDPVFVGVTCAVEFIWILTRSYKQSQANALALLRRVVTSEDAVVERIVEVREAIEIALEKGADFSDVMIVLAAQREGASSVVTFDRPAARDVPGMELLT